MGKQWCVLKSSQIDLQESLELDLDCSALILDVAVEDLDRVCLFFQSLLSALDAQPGNMVLPPCVALLSSAMAAPTPIGGVEEDGCEQLLSAQRGLHQLGLDEVILKGVSASETHLSVLMALQRIDHTRSSYDFWEAGIRKQERDQHSKALFDREKELRLQWAEDLWANASELRIARVLPRLDKSAPTKLDIGTVVGDLTVEALLGRGGFGTVCKAHNGATSQDEAVKIFPKLHHSSVDKILSVAAEIDAIRKLQHENIVAFLGAIHTRRHILLRMQYAGPMTLMKLLRRSEGYRLSLSWARELCQQLVVGIAFCHDRGIAHCDLKPENLGLDGEGSRLKVLDFGCAVKVESVVTKPKGTMPFMAPEVLAACAGSSFAPAGADVWAIGVVLLEMIAGIGSLNDLMGWPTDVEISSKVGEDILRILGEGPGLIRSLVAKFSGPPTADLAELLAAAFALEPLERASVAQLARNQWIARPRPKRDAATEGVAVATPPPRPHGRGPRPASRIIRQMAGDKATGAAGLLMAGEKALGAADPTMAGDKASGAARSRRFPTS